MTTVFRSNQGQIVHTSDTVQYVYVTGWKVNNKAKYMVACYS